MQFHFEFEDDSDNEYWKRWYHRPLTWIMGVGTDMSDTVAMVRAICIGTSLLLGTDMLLMAVGINLSPLWLPVVPILTLFYVLFTYRP